MDIVKSEATEKELDSLIRRRHESRIVEEGELVSEITGRPVLFSRRRRWPWK